MFLLACCGCCCGPLQRTASSTCETYKLGATFSMDLQSNTPYYYAAEDTVAARDYCYWCPDARQALQLWVEHVNAAGFTDSFGCPIQVELYERDDCGDPDRLFQAYSSLERAGVHAFIGPALPLLAVRAAQLTQQMGLMLFQWSLLPYDSWRRSRGGELDLVNAVLFEEKLAVERVMQIDADFFLSDRSRYGISCPYCSTGRRLTGGKPPPSGGQPPPGGSNETGNETAAPPPGGNNGTGNESTFPPGGTPGQGGPPITGGGDDEGGACAAPVPGAPPVRVSFSGSFDHWDVYYRSFNFTHTFDINVPPSVWMHQALYGAYTANSLSVGPRKFAFLAYGLSYQTQCQEASTFVSRWPGTQVFYIDVDFHIVLKAMSKVQSYAPEVIVVCGDAYGIVVSILVLKALGFNPQALVMSEPHGKDLVIRVSGYNVDGFMEPTPVPPPVLTRPDSTFGTYQGFLDAYQANYSEEAGIAGVQMAALGELVLQVMQNSDLRSAETAGAYLRSATLETLLGNYSFDERGRRRVVDNATGQAVFPGLTAARQFIAYPEDWTAISSMTRYNDAQVQLLSEEANASCSVAEQGDVCFAQYRAFEYPLPGWFDKEVLVYPCRAGCFIQNRNCLPCPKGQYRSEQDLQCRPCIGGEYADLPGMAACRECDAGAECTDATKAPQSSPGFFRVEILPEGENSSEALGETTAVNTTSTTTTVDVEVCSQPQSEFVNYSFIACEPTTVCVGSHSSTSNTLCYGSNTGLLCGQCPEGMTYHTWKVARRECTTCFNAAGSRSMTNVVLAAGIAGYSLFLWWMSWVAGMAKKKQALPVAVLRISMHYIFLLAAALENSTLDAELPHGLVVPLNFFYRPLDLFSVSCVLAVDHGHEHVRFGWEAAALMFPAGCVLILSIHLVMYLFSTLVAYFLYGCRTIRSIKVQRFRKAMEDSLEGSGKQFHPQASRVSQNHPTPDEHSIDSHAGVVRYVRVRQLHNIKRSFQTIWRQCLILMFMTFATAVRGISNSLQCRSLGSGQGDRVVMDFDLTCNSAMHQELTRFAVPALLMYLFGVPLVVYSMAAMLSSSMWSVWKRSVSAFLNEGLKPQHLYWEALMVLRLGVFIWAGKQSTINQRCVNMMVVLVVSLSLYLILTPYDNRDRQALHHLERMYAISIIFVIAAGFVHHANVSAGANDGFAFDAAFRAAGFAVTIAVNCIAIFYAVVVLYINTISLQLQALIDDGASVDSMSLWVHGLIRRMRGINKVGYFEENGSYFIDVSFLNEWERSFLVTSLAQTIHACMDSSDKFHTWLVEKALHEAFERAVKGRAANLRALYTEHGTRPWSLLTRFPIGKWIGPLGPTITLRPPDVAFTEGKDPIGESASRVTVEELHNALTSVDVDVLERHPGICSPMVEAKATVQVDEKANLAAEVVTWGRHQPLKVFEEDMEQHGTLKYRVDKPDTAETVAGENDVLKAMEAETEEHKKEKQKAEQDIEKKLLGLQDEINRMKEELGKRSPEALEELEHTFEREERDQALDNLLEGLPLSATSKKMATMSLSRAFTSNPTHFLDGSRHGEPEGTSSSPSQRSRGGLGTMSRTKSSLSGQNGRRKPQHVGGIDRRGTALSALSAIDASNSEPMGDADSSSSLEQRDSFEDDAP